MCPIMVDMSSATTYHNGAQTMLKLRIAQVARNDENAPDDRYMFHQFSENLDHIPTFAEIRGHDYAAGRCEGKVYKDSPNGPIHCGYIFAYRVARDAYHDGSAHTVETWITVERVTVEDVSLGGESL